MYRRTARCRSRAERETAMSAKFSRIVRLIGLAVVVGTLGAGTATAAPTPQGLKADGLRMQGIADAYQRLQTPPAASFYTPQALKADGLRMQGIADAYQRLKSPPAASFYTPQALKADGLRMQGIADAYQRLQSPPAASFYTPQALKAQGLRWQGVAQMFAAERASVSSSSSSGFDWSAALIGGASTLGFATVGVALLLGARRVRRTSVAV
jgi:hypothetical protein